MKKLMMTLTAAFAAFGLQAANMAGYMNISDVSLNQDSGTQDVIVKYKLENGGAPAYILLDIRTNGVSIGLDKLKTVSGDITTTNSPLISSETADKTIVWKARTDWRGHLTTNAEAFIIGYYTNAVAEIPGAYMVVDLSGGPTAAGYPVSYTLVPPVVNEENRTSKLWLRRCEPGTFMMGLTDAQKATVPDSWSFVLSGLGYRQVTLTHAFFAGVFPVTQGQYALVTGMTPADQASSDPAACCALNKTPVYDYRGTNTIAANTFLGLLRAKTGISFDLPTEAQWEYACRAGTTNMFYNGKDMTVPLGEDPALSEIAWYSANSGRTIYPVGLKVPNSWGLYDMLGNVWESCLDWRGGASYTAETDPTGSSSGNNHVSRGGSYDQPPAAVFYRGIQDWATGDVSAGFRLFMTIQ